MIQSLLMLAVELLKYRQLHCVEITWVLTLVGQETKGYTSKKKTGLTGIYSIYFSGK